MDTNEKTAPLPKHLMMWKACPICRADITIVSEEDQHYLGCSECPFVHFSNPFPTVSIMLFNKEKTHVLLAKRAREPKAGTWCLPGGFMDAGEDPVETAARELLEETCVEADPETWRVIGGYKGCYNPSFEMYTTNMHYMATVAVNQTPVAGSDAEAVKWVALDEMPDLPFENQRRALVDARKMLARD